MMSGGLFEIFLVASPGLEGVLAEEAREAGFSKVKAVTGGVTVEGTWRDVWRANLVLRGANRVLARLGSFRALHLAQLDKRARKFAWREVLRPDVPVAVEAACKSSRIYHAGAAAQRVVKALQEDAGISVSEDADITVMVRIEDDLVTLSVDTSGGLLHKRGYKEAVAKAPMRETMAALFLRQCGFKGHEPVLDPMCGSGTFVIEAAQWAAGLRPGRSRHFAFEQLATYDPGVWEKLKASTVAAEPQMKFYGSDRDAGAVRMAEANAKRAGVAGLTHFQKCAVSDFVPPEGPPGLVITNPPYGARIGDRKPLFGLYGALGKTLREKFVGWRVGIITTDKALAEATGLPFLPPARSVLHGGLRVTLYQTRPL